MELTQIVEALVFAAPDPLTTKEIARSVRRATEENLDPAIEPLKKVGAKEVQVAIDELSETYSATGRALQFVETSSGWRIFSRPEFASYIRALLPETKPERLSPPALETLAIIAYRQPITKADIEAVRGVSVDGVMQKIIDRGLVKIGGRADLPGRPLLYETTDAFLDHFGIKALEDLPNSGELSRIALPSAEDNQDAEQMTLDEAAAAEEEGDQAQADSEVEAEETSAPTDSEPSAEESQEETAPEDSQTEEEADPDEESPEPEPEAKSEVEPEAEAPAEEPEAEPAENDEPPSPEPAPSS